MCEVRTAYAHSFGLFASFSLRTITNISYKNAHDYTCIVHANGSSVTCMHWPIIQLSISDAYDHFAFLINFSLLNNEHIGCMF